MDKTDPEISRNIHRALAELESSVYDGKSVEFAYIQLETIASALRAQHPARFQADSEAEPDEVFTALVPCGMDKEAAADAAALEELSSQRWYDDGRENEEIDLEEAERLRDKLVQFLSDFLDLPDDHKCTPLSPSGSEEASS